MTRATTPALEAPATENSKRRPVHQISIGRVRAAIWQQTTTTGKTLYGVTLSRSYLARSGYRDTSTLNVEDLSNAAQLLTQAQAWILAQAS